MPAIRGGTDSPAINHHSALRSGTFRSDVDLRPFGESMGFDIDPLEELIASLKSGLPVGFITGSRLTNAWPPIEIPKARTEPFGWKPAN